MFYLMANTYDNERDKKIIDAIVYFKYLLPPKQFAVLISNFENLLADLQIKLNQQPFDSVQTTVGLKDISHFDLIL